MTFRSHNYKNLKFITVYRNPVQKKGNLGLKKDLCKSNGASSRWLWDMAYNWGTQQRSLENCICSTLTEQDSGEFNVVFRFPTGTWKIYKEDMIRLVLEGCKLGLATQVPKKENSSWINKKMFFTIRVVQHWKIYPERLCNLHPWRCSKPNGERS